MLSHELRNPLSAVLTAAHLLTYSSVSASDREQAATMVLRQGQHMARMLDDLLDVARITRGQITLQKKRLSLDGIVQDALAATRSLIEQLGHHLTVCLPPEGIPLEADATRLEQVLVNLLRNAAKYTDPGGRIGIEAELQGTEVVITVSDTGIGFTPDALTHIFEPFTQLGRSVDRSQGGLGLGLAVVKSLVELHNGRVWAESGGPGRGSRFEIRLPQGRVSGEGTQPDERFGGHPADPAGRRPSGRPRDDADAAADVGP
jgi:signal transduction histidine kinase